MVVGDAVLAGWRAAGLCWYSPSRSVSLEFQHWNRSVFPPSCSHSSWFYWKILKPSHNEFHLDTRGFHHPCWQDVFHQLFANEACSVRTNQSVIRTLRWTTRTGWTSVGLIFLLVSCRWVQYSSLIGWNRICGIRRSGPKSMFDYNYRRHLGNTIHESPIFCHVA